MARKLPDEVASINDCFEYVLHIKSVQPGQGFVPIEIHKVMNTGQEIDVDIATSEAFPFNYIVIISMVLIMIVIALLMIVLIRCRTNAAGKSNPEKDFPPPLPRPPDFMGLNNNRIYSSSDGSHTASSTPLPVLSSIPHCKVTPIEFEDSESDDMGDMNAGENQPMPRFVCLFEIYTGVIAYIYH